MYIQKLLLKNFRNYETFSLNFISGINIIFGDNGTGKTNILEAISVASDVKSFRKASDASMVRRSTDGYYIRASVLDGEYDRLFEVGFSKLSNLKKKCKIDSEKVAAFSDYYGNMLLIIASPDDLVLIDGEPEKKRKYLDSVIAKYDRTYLQQLSDFRRILKNRNHILKSGNGTTQLPVWNEMFAENASGIVKKRSSFLKDFSRLVEKYYCALSAGSNPVTVKYNNSLSQLEVPEILSVLTSRHEHDIYRKTSTAGPHRDSYTIMNDGLHFKEYASQGQKRLMALSFKLAERDIVERASQKKSILCFDDVFSELDKNKRNRLISLIQNDNQILVTVVDTELIDDSLLCNSKLFELR